VRIGNLECVCVSAAFEEQAMLAHSAPLAAAPTNGADAPPVLDHGQQSGADVPHSKLGNRPPNQLTE